MLTYEHVIFLTNLTPVPSNCLDFGSWHANLLKKNDASFQVQCSNIHFHAHSDGSTTIHQHRTCRKSSHAVTPDGQDNNNNDEEDLVDAEALANFPQHVERERYLGVRMFHTISFFLFHDSAHNEALL